ncbi:MAG: hypothetical protein WCC90_09400 [Methylocella sp.]
MPGQIAIVCLCVGAIVTGYAGIRQSRDSNEAKERAKQTLAAATKINEETEKIKGETERLAVNIWRGQHPFGELPTLSKLPWICPRTNVFPD